MTRRASRMLIGVLSVTTIVGVSAYALTHRGRAAAPISATTATTAKPAGKAGVTLMAISSDPATKPSSTWSDMQQSAAVSVTPGAGDVKPVDAKPLDVKPVADVKPLDVKPTALKAVATMAPAGSILADGKARIEAGELPAGRKMLNEALMSGSFTSADAAAARQLIAKANEAMVFSPRRFNDDPWSGSYTVASGDVLQKIAFKFGVTSELLLRVNGMTDARKLRAGAAIKIIQGPFHAVVNKKAFTIDLYLGSPGEKSAQYVTSYGVGLGKDDGTPTGTWIVESRIPNPKWWGARGLPPIEAGDPKNPLGKYWIALTGVDGKAEGQQSYGIHGTIEPDSIGKQASMGCIRMRNEDVTMVYEMLVAGKSTVVVKD